MGNSFAKLFSGNTAPGLLPMNANLGRIIRIMEMNIGAVVRSEYSIMILTFDYWLCLKLCMKPQNGFEE